MTVIIFAIRRDILLHKLRYSKTIKGDSSAALFGMLVALFIGYLTLASLGGSAIDMSDLTTLFYFFLFLITITVIQKISIITIIQFINILIIR